jgi:hypothetical protein
MAITLKLKRSLGSHEEQWLAKNIGPRMHYMHNSIGGQGWIAKLQYQTTSDGLAYAGKEWYLTLEDERYASFFLLMFPQ